MPLVMARKWDGPTSAAASARVLPGRGAEKEVRMGPVGRAVVLIGAAADQARLRA